MSIVLHSDINPNQHTVIEATDDGDIAVTHVEDFGDMLDANKAEALIRGKGIPKNKDEWRKVASIPLTLWHELMRQKVISADGVSIIDEPRFRRWLNDRDNRWLRTTEGKV